MAFVCTLVIFLVSRPNSLLKKASCLFQNTKREKCDFLFSHKIYDFAAVHFDKTSMFRDQA